MLILYSEQGIPWQIKQCMNSFMQGTLLTISILTELHKELTQQERNLEFIDKKSSSLPVEESMILLSHTCGLNM